MRFVPSCLAFALLLLSPALPSLADEELVGETGFSLDPSSPSVLGIDLAALETEVCGAQGPTRGAVLVIVHDGGGGALASIQVVVLSSTTGPKETKLATVRPISLSLIGPEPVQFWCGSFLYRLVLNRGVDQPLSVLTLWPPLGPGTAGTVSGTLAMAALLVLEPVSGGVAYTQPRPLSINLQGTYTVLARELVEADESPLVPFSKNEDRAVANEPRCLTTDEPYTTFCLAAPNAKIGLALD